jgi:DNA-binding transcriptional regulator YiaG
MHNAHNSASSCDCSSTDSDYRRLSILHFALCILHLLRVCPRQTITHAKELSRLAHNQRQPGRKLQAGLVADASFRSLKQANPTTSRKSILDYSKIDFTLFHRCNAMEKSIYSREYSLLVKELKTAREKKELTQADVASRLGQTQSFVSKVERGERRLDVVELRAFCLALGISFSAFMKGIDDVLGSPSS